MLLLRSWELVVSEVEATGLFTLVNIVDDMTEGTEALPPMVFFNNGKAYVASEAYDDETIEYSKPQLGGTDPSSTVAGGELVVSITKPSGGIIFASMTTDSGEPVDKLN